MLINYTSFKCPNIVDVSLSGKCGHLGQKHLPNECNVIAAQHYYCMTKNVVVTKGSYLEMLCGELYIVFLKVADWYIGREIWTKGKPGVSTDHTTHHGS